MKKIIFNDEIFEADKIIKTETDIIGQSMNGHEIFAFKGITDFTLFTLEEGKDWDLSKEDMEALSYLNLDYRLSCIELGI